MLRRHTCCLLRSSLRNHHAKSDPCTASVTQIVEYNQQRELQLPYGNLRVQGADNGLVFGLYLNKTAPQQMFEPTVFRPINISYQGTARPIDTTKITMLWRGRQTFG